jgi:hypothetical protein
MAVEFTKGLLSSVKEVVLGKHAAEEEVEVEGDERNGRPPTLPPRRKRRRLLNPSPGRASASREDAISISSSNTSLMPRPFHEELLAYADDVEDPTVPAANSQEVSCSHCLPCPFCLCFTDHHIAAYLRFGRR